MDIYGDLDPHPFMDPVTETLANRLGIPVLKLYELFPKEVWAELPTLLYNELLYVEQSGSRRVDKLKQLSNDPSIQSNLEDAKGRYGILAELPTTLTGSVGRYEFGTMKSTSSAMMLADDLRKSVAYALVAAGYDLVAQAGEDLVLEIPHQSEIDRQRPFRIATATAWQVVGSLARNCCRCRVATRW